MTKFYRNLFASAAIVALTMSVAHADVVLTYTGPTFSSVSGGQYTTSQRITGTLTLDNRLDPIYYIHTTGATVAQSRILDFSFTDGVQTITKGDPTISVNYFYIKTDATGANVIDADSGFQIVWGNGTRAIEDSVLDRPEVTAYFPGNAASTFNTYGTWTVAVVPEPGTYAMMLAGIAALGFMARRRSV